MKLNFTPLLILFHLSLYSQTTWYVDVDANGANNGSSWGDAFTDLQLGLEAATYGDQIWVATGVYYPSKDKNLNQPSWYGLLTFVIPDGVAIYGGFNGTEQLLTQRDWRVNTTVIRGAAPNANGIMHHVLTTIFMAQVDSLTILDGFKIDYGVGM